MCVLVAICCCGDNLLHLCTIQGISDAFQGMAAPLTLVLLVDVLTTTIYLAIGAFNGSALAALMIAITIMILWTFCSVCNLCSAKMFKSKGKRVLVDTALGVGGSLYLIGDNLPPILKLRSNIYARN